MIPLQVRKVSQPAPPKDGYKTLNSDLALSLLKMGSEANSNEKVVIPPIDSNRRLELACGQAPFCAFVTCFDTHVSPELLFGSGLDELLIIRSAENTVDTFAPSRELWGSKMGSGDG